MLNTKLTQSLQQTQAGDLEGPMPTLELWVEARERVYSVLPRTQDCEGRKTENHLAEPCSHASLSESTGDRMHVGGGVC